MQQKELKDLNDKGLVRAVVAVKSQDGWLIAIDEGDDGMATIRTARGGKREFKTLDSVSNMLAEIDIKSFSVC